MRISFFAILILFFPIFIFANSQNTISKKDPLIIKIRHPHRSLEKEELDITKEYKYQLIDLILSKTKQNDGEYKIEAVPTDGQNRIVQLLDSGVYNIYITMTSKKREEDLLPIRIPVYKGMYGYRIFLISKDKQNLFNQINSQEELKKLWAGQGKDWPDYKILTHNGYKVIGSHSWLTLYGMLSLGRFDYFPRGIHEPFKEILANPDKNLVVEKRFMLHYPAPGYIFVSKKNKKLAERLKKGFEIALKDGSFDKLFYNHPDIKNVLEKVDAKNRIIYELKNPLLSKETPLDNDSLWLKFE